MPKIRPDGIDKSEFQYWYDELCNQEYEECNEILNANINYYGKINGEC